MLGKFVQLRLQGVRDPFISMANGKAKAPPAPDTIGAAKETAAGNLEAAKYTTAANRVNQVTPYGNLTYTRTPTIDQGAYDKALADYQAQLSNYNQSLQSYNSGQNKSSSPFSMYSAFGNQSRGEAPLAPIAPTADKYQTGESWTATQTLSPEQQAIYDQESKLNQGLMTTANKGLDYANEVLSKPGVDTSKLPSYGINPGETYYDAIMRRLRPDLESQSAAEEARLANQGIGLGSNAYATAKDILGRTQNDARTSAVIQGMNTGLNANQQAFQQEAYNQMQPINVINALRTGSQVQGPSYAQNAQMPATAGADILGATNAQYANQVAATNAANAGAGGFMGGLMKLGSAAITASDINLKENIKKVGSLDNGLNLYSYNYKDGYDLPEGRQVGVMAQEVETVMPEAVVEMDNGFKGVNYAMLGL